MHFMMRGGRKAILSGTNSVAAPAFVGALAQDGVATPEQISLVLPIVGTPSQYTSSTVRFRVTGSSTWTDGHPLYRVVPSDSNTPAIGAVDNVLAWPIIDLIPGTSYDIEATVSGTFTGSPVTKTLTTSTRALPAAAGTPNKTITAGSSSATIQTALNGLVAGDVIQFENGSYTLSGITLDNLAGTVNSRIYIRGQSRSGVTLTDTTGSIFQFLNACSNLIIENLTLVGSGSDSGTAASSVAFSIAGSATQTNVTVRNITCTGVDKFLDIWYGTGCLIYYCNITGNNLWSTAPTDFLGTNLTWNDSGILMAGDGNCAWNNTIKGFGDTFSYCQHAGNDVTAPGSNIHYFRNDIINSCDDPIEVDHAERNCTWYDNRITNGINADSIDPLYGGPWLSARNVSINTYRVNTHKWNDKNAGQFLYNNTLVTTVSLGTDADVANWYQPNNGPQERYGYRNNLHVYRGAGQSIWIESGGHTTLDFCNNGWYPDRTIQWVGVYANLATAQSGLSATTPIFSGKQRMVNDVIVLTDPFTTDITLGANALTEITTFYTPIIQAGSAALNAGMAIPNITDGFSGAAPTIGAIIAGRATPAYGDVFPSWYPSAGVVVEINSGTTVSGAALSGGAGSFPGTSPSDLCAPWCGGALVYVGGKPYLVVLGGGHTDGAWNGLIKFGPLYGAGSDTPSWSIFLASSAVGSVVEDAAVYSDGRRTSDHTYNSVVGVNDTLYAMAVEAAYGGPAFASGRAFKCTPSGETEIATNPRTQKFGAASYHNGNIYYHTGAGDFDKLRVYNIAGNSWSSESGADQAFALIVAGACDTNRGGFYLTNAADGCYWKTSDLSRFTGQTAPSTYDEAVLFDPDRDVFVSYVSNSLTLRERSASASFAGTNPAWTNRTFTGTTPPASVAAGTFGRFCYVPELKGYLAVPTSSSHVYFYRST